MRNTLTESLIVGGAIGLLALAIHRWTDASTPGMRLLVLILAALGLGLLQLGFMLVRLRQRGPTPPSEPDQPPGWPQSGRRNPFVRELTSDWTGLEDSAAEPAARPALSPAPSTSSEVANPTPSPPPLKREGE